MNEQVLALLATLAPAQLAYLAKLVDEDTTGNQDDDLYTLLMKAYDATTED